MKKFIIDSIQAHVPKRFLLTYQKKLESYRKELASIIKSKSYEMLESSVYLPFDLNLIEDVSQLVKQKKHADLKYIILIGIGGANLGVKAIIEAFHGSCSFFKQKQIQFFFLDTINPQWCLSLIKFLQNKRSSEFLIIFTSSSGQTTEVVVNFESLSHALSKHFKNLFHRIIIITKKESPLFKKAQTNNIACLTIPSIIGDRFGIFSTIGILPLALAGFDVKNFQKGAQQAALNGIQNSIEENPPLLSAILTYFYYKQGISIHNTFLFDSNMESLGKWYRQLMAESLGKKQDLDKKNVRTGITPLVSMGTVDLHSMVQIYLAGPKDKFTNFVYLEKTQQDIKLPKKLPLPQLIEDLEGKTHEQIIKIILFSTMLAYKKQRLPFISIGLPDMSLESLGYYMQFRMLEIMYLAKLLNINAFDQPNVEDYKKEVRRMLKEGVIG
ncbi:hypothetical protein CO172_02910 [Candidatus Uhrbacteria bacterium CG_4_9_14_3_um_filter_36_7]|uniref:Glucose-6-phosphate isomerase n=1 Tax=Candidatus Uhrbacteria bacterium CG_4_9_14_3_um_filter_36_7 TaxID=1975033 RepID=A0A2M7XH10_9BACT|nr:MAG: hypothetical protein CO172_02910 [Candidatus Uhrbacteria bacterium CG_4_9_14_3_um_filter_36_7]